MTITNVLITSAGRRVRLVQNFQEALRTVNPAGKVLATDMHPELSSACHVADRAFRVPRVSDPGYIAQLLDICREQHICLVVPTIDTELSILADAKEMFRTHGIVIAVSSRSLCETFYRKRPTQNFFEHHGFSTPREITDFSNCVFPLFAKLDNSSCSIGVQRVTTLQEAQILAQNPEYVLQELIEGEEYTIDLFVDRHGKAVRIVPRRRLEVRAGEVSKALTCKDPRIIDSVKRLTKVLEGAYGCLTLQLFKQNNALIYIEINPRFGGGYPLSWQSGADFAALLIADIAGAELTYEESWRDGALMLRYDAEVIV